LEKEAISSFSLIFWRFSVVEEPPPKEEEKTEVVEAKPENLPEPSKWEKSEDEAETSRDEAPKKSEEEEKSVTVEVIKRAENAIFKKAINAIRPERKVFLDTKMDEQIQVCFKILI
jgi:hypothetical protein